jgi:hypothetical protein
MISAIIRYLTAYAHDPKDWIKELRDSAHEHRGAGRFGAA